MDNFDWKPGRAKRNASVGRREALAPGGVKSSPIYGTEIALAGVENKRGLLDQALAGMYSFHDMEEAAKVEGAYLKKELRASMEREMEWNMSNDKDYRARFERTSHTRVSEGEKRLEYGADFSAWIGRRTSRTRVPLDEGRLEQLEQLGQLERLIELAEKQMVDSSPRTPRSGVPKVAQPPPPSVAQRPTQLK